MRRPIPQARFNDTDFEIAVVGAGISGIGAAIECKRRGFDSFVLLEARSRLGGTWLTNNYPGIAVDISSSSYCYPFETQYPWSRAFAPGHEILSYIEHCSEKYKIDAHVRYDSKVIGAVFDGKSNCWSVHLERGGQINARFLLDATGIFGEAKFPEYPGLDEFAGSYMHSSRWDHSCSMSGKSVAVIGTGASAVQIVPEISKNAAELSVFQRTAIWITPKSDHSISEWRLPGFNSAPVCAIKRFLSELNLEFLTFSIVNFRRFPLIVRAVQVFLEYSMRRQIKDSRLANLLIPDYGLGCKRPTRSNTYLPTFNQPHVSLVTEPINNFCSAGVVTDDGKLHKFDVLVFATGFETTERGNMPPFPVVGHTGSELGQFWEDYRLQAYAGVSIPGFPNFFLTAGPYSGGFNWFTMLAAHLDHIFSCIEKARSLEATYVEVKQDAHRQYMNHMWRRSNGTIFKDSSCATARSYYIDRHGDASLPFPHTPWWRVMHNHRRKTKDYQFGHGANG
ncbi:flavin-containing monooxygenase [Pseudomonadota bacterium]